MRPERTEIDFVPSDELVESEVTAREAVPDDLEDTFRSGPPGGISMPRTPETADTADTGEMLAAQDLEEAPPTAVTPIPSTARKKVRVVERSRPPPPAAKAPAPALRLPRPASVEAAPRAAPEPQGSYNPFITEDPPAVGVDPAMFPIHRTAPGPQRGQQIILALTAVLIAIVAIAFMTGPQDPQARAAERREQRRQQLAQAMERRLALMRTQQQQRVAQETSTVPGTGAHGAPVAREARIRRPLKASVRQRPPALIRPAEIKPYTFSDERVAQPRSYGDQPENVPPPGTGPMLIVMSEPPALVYRDSKLFGATPLMLPVDGDTTSMTVTLRTFGYREKTIDVKPGASGNLEASVVLEKDPRYDGATVVRTEKPRKG